MVAAMHDGIDIGAILGPGVYLLLVGDVVVYVGQSRTPLTRVYTHRTAWKRKASGNRPVPWIKTPPIKFDGVRIVPCPWHRLNELERELIAKHRPRHNLVHKEATGAPRELVVRGVRLTLRAPEVAIAPPPPRFERRV